MLLNIQFLNDLRNNVKEIRYAGVKALGYLAKNNTNVSELKKLLLTEVDHRIKLEIYASLLRLGEDVWDEFKCYAMSISEEMYRFEYVLILGELSTLKRLQMNYVELRLIVVMIASCVLRQPGVFL